MSTALCQLDSGTCTNCIDCFNAHLHHLPKDAFQLCDGHSSRAHTHANALTVEITSNACVICKAHMHVTCVCVYFVFEYQCDLRWRGYFPLYLPLIICNCVMNTIMRIMNFINAMPCTCADRLHLVLHILDVCFSQFWLHLLQILHVHSKQVCTSFYVLSFRFAFSRWRSISETWLKFLL